MQQTPDISKIVNVIMQNPAIISEIASLMNSNTEDTEETVSEVSESTAVTKETDVKSEEASVMPQPKSSSRTRRKDLLYAMKPYLSEQRQSAIDSMSSILDILDVMTKKET